MAVIRDVSSPVGEVDWNTLLEFSRQIGYRVFPCGGSGLKYCGGVLEKRATRCLPLWGKWIEIPFQKNGRLISSVSSPVGEVDWNIDWRKLVRIFPRVFPCGGSGLKCRQHPLRIEVHCVFPCGGSGLKYNSRRDHSPHRKVSSPVGEVDWNLSLPYGRTAPCSCLPLWGKWIEIRELWWSSPLQSRVFPCGGSGLKYHNHTLVPGHSKCLPLWGKWIEISGRRLWEQEGFVSSPVGEVDWNFRFLFAETTVYGVFPCGGSGLK